MNNGGQGGEPSTRGFSVFSCICLPSSWLVHVHWYKSGSGPCRLRKCSEFIVLHVCFSRLIYTEITRENTRFVFIFSCNSSRHGRGQSILAKRENQAEDHRRATSAILQTEGYIAMNLMSWKPLLNQDALSPEYFDDVQSQMISDTVIQTICSYHTTGNLSPLNKS